MNPDSLAKGVECDSKIFIFYFHDGWNSKSTKGSRRSSEGWWFWIIIFPIGEWFLGIFFWRQLSRISELGIATWQTHLLEFARGWLEMFHQKLPSHELNTHGSYVFMVETTTNRNWNILGETINSPNNWLKTNETKQHLVKQLLVFSSFETIQLVLQPFEFAGLCSDPW